MMTSEEKKELLKQLSSFLIHKYGPIDLLLETVLRLHLHEAGLESLDDNELVEKAYKYLEAQLIPSATDELNHLVEKL